MSNEPELDASSFGRLFGRRVTHRSPPVTKAMTPLVVRTTGPGGAGINAGFHVQVFC